MPRRHTPSLRVAGAICVLYVCLGSLGSGATLEFVPIGHAGNPPDSTGFGSVSYEYAISKYEVTNAVYAEFLNLVDPTAANARGLYSSEMSAQPDGGILLIQGAANGSKYAVKPGYGSEPATNMDFFSVARFMNWLHNGQGIGDTETGAYTMSLGFSVPRNGGARFWIPSQSEWYKAAYYQPASVGGDTDGYWRYPTRSNAIPNSRPGNNFDANSANFFRDDGSPDDSLNDGFAKGPGDPNSTNLLTDVGAYSAAPSFYGTFDQGGNVREWVDAIGPVGGQRGLWRGGTAVDFEDVLSASYSPLSPRPPGSRFTGIRIGATLVAVPEPTSGAMIAASVCLLSLRRIP